MRPLLVLQVHEYCTVQRKCARGWRCSINPIIIHTVYHSWNFILEFRFNIIEVL